MPTLIKMEALLLLSNSKQPSLKQSALLEWNKEPSGGSFHLHLVLGSDGRTSLRRGHLLGGTRPAGGHAEVCAQPRVQPPGKAHLSPPCNHTNMGTWKSCQEMFLSRIMSGEFSPGWGPGEHEFLGVQLVKRKLRGNSLLKHRVINKLSI